MESSFKVGQVVKYSKPQPGEEHLRFYVNEIHQADGDLKEKLHVELICEENIKPTFCHFSDEYEPFLSQEGPVRYNRSDVSAYEVKKLRRGDYIPDMMLDLHGLTQQQAKSELGALIEACRRQHIRCACVMHGHGKNILKQRIPLWLAQHPDVMAFHQAPKLWGGDAAILVLIEQNS